jgi:hypothetical protein
MLFTKMREGSLIFNGSTNLCGLSVTFIDALEPIQGSVVILYFSDMSAA